jgi:hypothetical protein
MLCTAKSLSASGTLFWSPLVLLQKTQHGAIGWAYCSNENMSSLTLTTGAMTQDIQNIRNLDFDMNELLQFTWVK